MDNITRLRADNIIYGSYVKNDRLDKIVYESFSNTNISSATELNIFVDLNSVLHPLFSEHYRIDTPGLTIITSCLINLCGHYRSFFRRLRVHTNFFMVFSKNTHKLNTDLVPEYNGTFKMKSSIKESVDFTKSNFDLLNLLCPYLPDIYFIESKENFEVGVIIGGLIEKLNNGIPNMIISKDIYNIQLTYMYPNTSMLVPVKTKYGDESIIIPISEKVSYRDEFWSLVCKKIGIKVDLYKDMSPINFPLFLALTHFAERDLIGLVNGRTAKKMITSMVGVEDIKIDINQFMIVNNLFESYPSLPNRFNALDISYALPYYRLSPEYKDIQLLNLRDDEKLNHICSMDVFVEPIDLTRL